MTLEDAQAALTAMQDDPSMITESRYSPTATEYPDNLLPFVEIHMAYLRKNKAVDPRAYISNLEIMIKRR